MTPNYPHHSDDAYMEAEPVQSFVGTAYEPSPEEAEQLRLGRLARKPATPADGPSPPAGTGQPG
ncbi:MAG: hypothetical protein K2X87_21840 [Gemmataceae bacterium]|nr:hypothetical protein [Gemmataceae bacterium]